MEKVTLVCIMFLAAAAAIAQTKTAALKFDELIFDEQLSYSETESSTQSRIDRLAKRLRLERNKNLFIIHYRARVMHDSHRNRISNLVNSARWSATGNTVTSDDVSVIDGGLREHDTVEFWIAPKNTEPPIPTPTFNRSEGIECPSIYAYQAGNAFDKNSPLVLTAGTRPSGAEVYNWTLSDGDVIGPNGRSRLEVDVSKVSGSKITAFLELEGVPLPCKNRALVVAEFGNTARLVDEFGRVSNGDLRGRLDSFLAELSNKPSVQGYIYIYGRRSEQGRDAESRRRLLMNHFTFRNFDTSRITIVKAGFREEFSNQLWLVPPGADLPSVRPSVDESFVRAVRPAPAKRAE